VEKLLKEVEQTSLADRIGRIEKLETELLHKAAEFMRKGVPFTYSHIFVIGALKRTLAQSSGFRDMITAKKFSMFSRHIADAD
jgi:hypothetical protein